MTNTAPNPQTGPFPADTTRRQVAPKELLERLRWGEPALTIVDIRDRTSYNGERITGAVPMPMDQLPEAAESQLEYKRDIYVYGDSNESVAEAAQTLRQAGFQNVAELQNGLDAWKAVDGPTEGVYAFSSPATPPKEAPATRTASRASEPQKEPVGPQPQPTDEPGVSPDASRSESSSQSQDSSGESADKPQS